MDEKTLSIVIPAYNESKRIRRTLDELEEYLKDRPHCEVIVVDDGSTDNTADIASEYRERIQNLIVLRNKRNRGKGYSVKRGMLRARGGVPAVYGRGSLR